MTSVIRIFLSLRTAVVFFLAFIAAALAGSLILTGNLAFYSGIDDTPLFRWLAENRNMGINWWLFFMIAVLTGLAVNTVFCTAEGLLKGFSRQNLLLRLSPQLMHGGVLFIMLGHLVTASFGFKLDLQLQKGQVQPVAEGLSILLEDLAVETDRSGYPSDWQVKFRWIEGGNRSPVLAVKPLQPVYRGQFGIYSKSADAEQASALIRVSRDPGAVWALMGGLLLCLGGAGFVFSRFLPVRREAADGMLPPSRP